MSANDYFNATTDAFGYVNHTKLLDDDSYRLTVAVPMGKKGGELHYETYQLYPKGLTKSISVMLNAARKKIKGDESKHKISIVFTASNLKSKVVVKGNTLESYLSGDIIKIKSAFVAGACVYKQENPASEVVE